MPIKVIITSDFLCPWCYLGEARLQKAIQALGPQAEVELEWKPYELNPTMPAEGMDRKQYRSAKFGWERSLQMDAQLTELGREEGLSFNYPAITRAANTRLAHRLTLFAQRHGLASEYAQRVFKAYFEEGQDIGARSTLLSIVADLGLDPGQAAAFLDHGEGEAEVVAAELQAMRQGVRGVPHFQIGEHTISGAQNPAAFCAVLQTAAAARAD